MTKESLFLQSSAPKECMWQSQSLFYLRERSEQLALYIYLGSIQFCS